MSEPIRLLIVDDHELVRQGFVAMMSVEPAFEVVGQAADGVEAVELAHSLQPDVILLDLAMPRMDGIEAAREIKSQNPGARILVITSFAEDEKVLPAIKAGALGYLLKDSSPPQLIEAIRDVHGGRSSLHPTIARMVIGELNKPPNLPPTRLDAPTMTLPLCVGYATSILCGLEGDDMVVSAVVLTPTTSG